MSEQLDPEVVQLAKAIGRVESGGKYDARGGSREFGAYQYTPETWAAQAKKYLGRDVPLEAASRADQDEVVYRWIKEKKDAGFNAGQIASMHNAGEGRPNAHKEGHTGTNKYGVQFDTPGYVRKVAEAYGGTSQAPVSTGGGYAPPQRPQPYTPDVSTSETEPEKSLVQKGLEFFFPILENKKRTALETVGDVGLSALTLVPGLGAAGLAAKGAKLAATGAKVASKASSVPGLIAKGAGVGYGADVAGNLSEGKTDAGEILTPGLGTAIGGVGGGLVGGASKLAPSILSRTSGVPRAAMDIATEQPGKVSGLIKNGVTPESARKVAVGAVKDLRKKMSSEWETGVQNIVDKYEGVRVGLPETVGNELKDIASRYNTATKQRIGIPQNPLSMSAKELTNLIKDINGIKYNPLQPDRALSDMKKYLKELGKKSFNEGDEFTSLYANYATKSEILESADDIVRAFKAKKPTQITTAINRLQKIFDEDKEEYFKAIQALERETGIDILSGVAAGKVKPIMPDFGRGFDLGDILKLAGFMVTSPRAAFEINKLLQGTSGAIGKTIRGAAGMLPVLPGLSGTQGVLAPPQ